MLVRFAAGTSPAQRADMRSRAGVQREAMFALRGLELVAPKAGVSVGEAVSGLEGMPGVLYAEPDAARSATAVPNDPGYPQQWGLPVINAPAAWDVTTGSPQVTVAIVDTGIDAADADLAPNIWTNPGESGVGARPTASTTTATGGSTTSTAGTSSAATTSRRTATATAPTWRAQSARAATTASASPA